MQPRTRRQKEVLDIIESYVERNGHWPSYQAIANKLGVSSKSGIARYIRDLEFQGLVNRNREKGFKLEICPPKPVENVSRLIEWVPTRGEGPKEAWEREPFILPTFLLGMYADAEVFACRVEDDAMNGKDIFDGDIVLIEKRTFAREGTIVAATVGSGRPVLRRYYRSGSHIELRPANDDYEEIRESADRVRIEGVYRALLRPAG